MANWEHLEILKQGVEAWNEWREADLDVEPDLSEANLSQFNLKGADLYRVSLQNANLRGTDLRDAKLKGANLYRVSLQNAKLENADLGGVNLMGANLKGSDLRDAKLMSADLQNAKLRDAKLIGADLRRADLKGADLRDAFLYGAILGGARIQNAKLSGALLIETQALGTDFTGATLTGACIQDWNINADTKLNDVICDYVYLKHDAYLDDKEVYERRPSDPDKNFAPGEFTKLFQKAHETVDLIFRNGVDWQTLLISLDKLRVEADGAEFPIQAIESKDDGDFIVRLKTPPEANKAEVEKFVKQEYETQLHLLESRYEERLQLQGEQLAFYREQTEFERNRNTKLDRIIEVLAENQSGNTYHINQSNAQFAGGSAIGDSASANTNNQSGDIYNGTIKATNFVPHGTAIGGTFNDYSQTITNNLDEIQQLISALRSQAEQFPQDARNEVLEHLNDLQDDLQHPDQVKPSRLKATFAALLAIAVGLGGAVATATDFTNNVLELGNKFGVELVHP